jgi:FkbM family methyltransferase
MSRFRSGEFRYDLDQTGEEELIQAFMASVPDGHRFVFFDVGANRGDWTGYITDHAVIPYEGHLFDVSLVMAERLRENFRDNENIIVNPYALSDSNSEVEYLRYVEAEGVNTMVVDSNFYTANLESEIATGHSIIGDEYCAENGIEHIDFMKIDTEGWEWPVLKGFERMLTEKRIDLIQFEYGFLTADHHVSMKDFWRLFNDYGYEVGPLSKEGIVFREFLYWDNTYRDYANYVARLPK